VKAAGETWLEFPNRMIIPTSSQLRRMLRYLGWPIVIFLIWDIAVVVSYVTLHDEQTAFDLPVLPLSLLGSALVLFVSFRNNSAYARWWEARTLWGSTVNASRSFARQVLSCIDDGPEGRRVKRRLLNRQIAYVHALRCHLRRQLPCPELAEFLEPGEPDQVAAHANQPNAILTGSGRLLAEAARRGLLSEFRHMQIERAWWTCPMPRAAWSASRTRRCHGNTPSFRASLCMSSACCCRSGWWMRWATSPRWPRWWWA
jgi:putative membrane protein